VAGGWRRLHNEEFHNFHASPNIIRVIKLKLRWEGHVARMEEMRNMRTISVGNMKGREHSEDLGIVGEIILQWILGNWI
jgi:hypothetical protein